MPIIIDLVFLWQCHVIVVRRAVETADILDFTMSFDNGCIVAKCCSWAKGWTAMLKPAQKVSTRSLGRRVGLVQQAIG